MKRRFWMVFFALFLGAAKAGWGEVQYSPGETRDPFFETDNLSRRPEAGFSSSDSWTLEGILRSPLTSSAQVNGNKVTVGDFVGDAEVVMIDIKGVKLRRGGKEGYLTKQGIQWT